MQCPDDTCEIRPPIKKWCSIYHWMRYLVTYGNLSKVLLKLRNLFNKALAVHYHLKY